MKKIYISLVALFLIFTGCQGEKPIPIVDTIQLERDYGDEYEMQTLIDLLIRPGDELVIMVHPDHEGYMYYTREELELKEWVEGVKHQLKQWDEFMESSGRTDVSKQLKKTTR